MANNIKRVHKQIVQGTLQNKLLCRQDSVLRLHVYIAMKPGSVRPNLRCTGGDCLHGATGSLCCCVDGYSGRGGQGRDSGMLGGGEHGKLGVGQLGGETNGVGSRRLPKDV